MDESIQQKNTAFVEKMQKAKRLLLGKLLRWCFRWSLTALLLAYLLPKYPVLIWLVYIFVPLGIFNLVMILRLYFKLGNLGKTVADNPDIDFDATN